MKPRVVSYNDAALALGISIGTLYRRIAEGKLAKAPTGRRCSNRKPEMGVVLTGPPRARARASAPASGCEASAVQRTLEAGPPAPGGLVVAQPVPAPAGPVGPRNEPAHLVGPADCDLPANVERGTSPALSGAEGNVERRLPSHIPVTRDGIPDLEALRQMGLERQAAEFERRFRAVIRLRALLANAPYGARTLVYWQVAHEFNIGESTVRSYERSVEQYGWAGLMPAWGGARGTCRAIPEELQRWILDSYAYQGCYTYAQIYEQVVRPYFREHDDEVAPHPATVRAFVKRSCPEIVRSLARDGRRAYEETHVVRVVRDLESAGVNGWWVSDHRLADQMVLVPDGKGAGWPSGCRKMFCTCGSGLPREECCSVRRPWWTVTADVCSAAFVGWRMSLQPSAPIVSHMIHEAIGRFGLCGHWMRDNGKEFLANRLGGKPLRGTLGDPAQADLGGADRWPAEPVPSVAGSTVWDQLDVQVVTAIPYSSWSKYIESLFGAWSRRYENALPGYTGRAAARRPEKLEAEIERGALLTIDQYVEALGKQITDWNETHVVGERRQPPLGYYKDYVPRYPDPQTLTFLLQDRRRLVVRHGRLLLSAGPRQHLYISEALALYSGVAVEVLWDPGDCEWIWVYPGDGRVLAVREVPLAQYGEWSETNVLAKRASRAQREHIAEWSLGIKGACPRELMDPYGAHQAVADRVADARALASQRLTLPAAELSSAKQLAAQAETERDEPQPRPRSIYSQIEEDVRRQAQ